MKAKRLLLGAVVSLLSILLTLALLEIGVRVYSASTASPGTTPHPLHVRVDSPLLYSLNPAHPEVNSLGMRDDEVEVAKPPGTFRVLVLGDSVAYGDGVPRRSAFPDRLEALLRATRPSAEVLNTAALGYTPYNELQYFLTRGRTLQPDLVLVAFCLNDVANPRLHWNYTQDHIVEIPPEAIPNPEYDRTHAIPVLRRRQEAEQRRRWQFLRQHSRLFRLIESKVSRLRPAQTDDLPDLNAKVPTHITGEDTLSIEVLVDETSSESQWLRSMYDQLLAAVQHERSRLAIVFFPVAYQLDPAYPYVPQTQLMNYCNSRAIPCLDLLPALRAHPREEIFLLRRSGYDDIWHLTEQGHVLVADMTLRFLQERRLLDEANRHSAVSR